LLLLEVDQAPMQLLLALFGISRDRSPQLVFEVKDCGWWQLKDYSLELRSQTFYHFAFGLLSVLVLLDKWCHALVQKMTIGKALSETTFPSAFKFGFW